MAALQKKVSTYTNPDIWKSQSSQKQKVSVHKWCERHIMAYAVAVPPWNKQHACLVKLNLMGPEY